MEEAASICGSRSILLAEDSAGDVYLVKMALKDHGLDHEVHVVSDGESAILAIDRLDAAQAQIPQAMILDLHLPKLGGLEVLAHLRSRGFGRELPVIVLTSSDYLEFRVTAEKYGRVSYFRKPSSLKDFLRLGSVARELIESRNIAPEKSSTAAGPGG